MTRMAQRLQINRRDYETIETIVARVLRLSREVMGLKPKLDGRAIIVGLALAHRELPLDLELLLDADDSDLIHDVFGIMQNIDLDTGRLRNSFVPRSARFQNAPLNG
jgi:hypothetical protein